MTGSTKNRAPEAAKRCINGARIRAQMKEHKADFAKGGDRYEAPFKKMLFSVSKERKRIGKRIRK